MLYGIRFFLMEKARVQVAPKPPSSFFVPNFKVSHLQVSDGSGIKSLQGIYQVCSCLPIQVLFCHLPQAVHHRSLLERQIAVQINVKLLVEVLDTELGVTYVLIIIADPGSLPFGRHSARVVILSKNENGDKLRDGFQKNLTPKA